MEESFWKGLWTCRLTNYWWWWWCYRGLPTCRTGHKNVIEFSPVELCLWETTNAGHLFHSSELTQCDRHKVWMCLWISTVTFCIHPDFVQPVEHKSSNTPSLICNILFVKLQCNKMVLHLSGFPVKVSLPSTRVAFSEMWPIKGPHVSNNRTVQLIEERFISLQVSVSKPYFTFISFYQRMHIYCY